MHDENSLLGPGGKGRTADHHSDGNTTLCNVEQLSLQSRKAETLDDDVGEDTESADDQAAGHLQQRIKPDSRVSEHLHHLVLLEHPVLNTSLIGAHSLDHQPLVLLAPALGLHRAIGQIPAHEQSPGAGGYSEHKEQKLPGFDGVASVVFDTVRQQTTDLLLSDNTSTRV